MKELREEDQVSGGTLDDWPTPRLRVLVESVVDLMAARGFHETSVRDIASAVGWNMATVYRYVEDKRDLLFHIHRWINERIAEELHAWKPSYVSAKEDFQQLLACYLSAVQRNSAYLRFVFRESQNLKAQHHEMVLTTYAARLSLFASVIERGIQSGEFQSVDSQLMAMRICFAVQDSAIYGDIIDLFTEPHVFAEFSARTLAAVLLKKSEGDNTMDVLWLDGLM